MNNHKDSRYARHSDHDHNHNRDSGSFKNNVFMPKSLHHDPDRNLRNFLNNEVDPQFNNKVLPFGKGRFMDNNSSFDSLRINPSQNQSAIQSHRGNNLGDISFGDHLGEMNIVDTLQFDGPSSDSGGDN